MEDAKKERSRLRRYMAVLVDGSLSGKRRALHVLKGMLVVALGLLLLLGLYGLFLIPFTPSLDELAKQQHPQPSVVLAADGQELTRFRQRNQAWVPLEAISPHVVDALIATEDHRFYTHGGIDPRRVAGAGVRTLLGDRQGGSTLTQQLARNLYPERIGRAFSVTRKLKEIITAFKIESVYTKEEILETYLNTVPFLYNVHGIELAARTYFGTSAAELDLLESATLVGMLKGTSYYNPVRQPERARARRNIVLVQMVKHGALAAEAYERLREKPLEVDFSVQPRPTSRAPHFTEHVRRRLAAWADRHGYNLYTDGLVIHTTLDTRLQTLAEKAVGRYGEALQTVADVEWGRSSGELLSTSLRTYPRHQRAVEPFAHFWKAKPDVTDAFIRATPAYQHAVATGEAAPQVLARLRADASFMQALRAAKTRLEIGFVALDPATGQVKAWVGSRDYGRAPFDHVADARRQPGSTFKPFVYAAALENGFSPEDRLPDDEVQIRLANDQTWRPSNAEGTSGEAVTLREGLAHSKNTISAQLIQAVGADRVAALARKMGVNRSELRAVPSLALGTSEVSLLEMVSAYGTIAAAGRYRELVWVTHIADRAGNVLATFAPESETALSAATARQLLDMMRGVVDYGTGAGVRRTFGIDADVAGKTGTTQEGADGWFILMHPELVGGAWVGFDDPRVTFRSAYWGQGAHNALYVVGDVFRQALDRRLIDHGHAFDTPSGGSDGPAIAERIGRWLGHVIDQVDAALRDRDDDRRARSRKEERNDLEEAVRAWLKQQDWGQHQEELEREVSRLLEDVWQEAQQQRAAWEREVRQRQRELERERRRLEREQQRIGW